MLISAVATTTYVANLIVFICIFSWFCGILGMYVLGDIMDDILRESFPTFSRSLMTCFQLLIGDSWTSIMWSALIAKGESGVGGYVSMMCSVVMVLGFFCFCTMLCKNLFVAIIIKNFQVTRTLDEIAAPGSLSAFSQLVKSSWQQYYQVLPLYRLGLLKMDVNTGRVSTITPGIP